MNETDQRETELKKKPRRVKQRRRWFIVLALFGSLIASFVVLEAALRIYVAARGWTPNCYAGHLSLFRPHPELGAELAPSVRLKSAVFNISTNSLGFRGPEISTVKPQGTIRIAILGGSSVFGYLVSDGDEAAQILEKNLRAQGHQVEVINAGVPGYNLFQTRFRFQQVVVPLNPDIVILYAGCNDISYLKSNDPSAERWRKQSISPAWERYLGHTVTYGFLSYRLNLGNSGLMNITSGDGPLTQAGQQQFRSNLHALADEVENAGAQLIVCSQATAAHPDIDDRLKKQLGTTDDELKTETKAFDWIRRELRQFAELTGADFIDVSSEIPPTADYLGDMIHLTKPGEQKLGRVLLKHLLPLVSRLNRTE